MVEIEPLCILCLFENSIIGVCFPICESDEVDLGSGLGGHRFGFGDWLLVGFWFNWIDIGVEKFSCNEIGYYGNELKGHDGGKQNKADLEYVML